MAESSLSFISHENRGQKKLLKADSLTSFTEVVRESWLSVPAVVVDTTDGRRRKRKGIEGRRGGEEAVDGEEAMGKK